jgi:hypothetical protein
LIPCFVPEFLDFLLSSSAVVSPLHANGERKLCNEKKKKLKKMLVQLYSDIKV